MQNNIKSLNFKLKHFTWKELPQNNKEEIIELEISENNFSLSSSYTIDKLINFLIINDSNNNTIGFLSYKQHDDNIDVYNIIINQTYRKIGLGTKLIHSLYNFNIILEVNSKNDIAYNFYTNLNFKFIKRIPRYYNNTTDCLVMYRKKD